MSENENQERNLLKQYLKTTLNFSDNEFASLYEDDKLKPEAIKELETKHAEKVAGLKDNKEAITSAFNEGEKKGRAISLSKWEKDLKTEFEFESEAKGVDLIKDLLAKKTKTEIKEEQIKVHPLFIELEKNSVPKKQFDELNNEFLNFKQSKERETVEQRLTSDGEKIVLGMNPVLPKDPVKAKNVLNLFLSDIVKRPVKLQDDGKHLLMDGDKRKEDAHGNPITFDKFVSERAASYFDFAKQEFKGNAGNNNEGNVNIKVPTNDKEYAEAVSKATTPEERVKIKEAFHSRKA